VSSRAERRAQIEKERLHRSIREKDSLAIGALEYLIEILNIKALDDPKMSCFLVDGRTFGHTWRAEALPLLEYLQARSEALEPSVLWRYGHVLDGETPH
jgi:hypothetical protein